MNTNNEHHTMTVIKRYDNGVEEWYCSTCGRHFMLQWPPEYKRIVLEPGDESAVHSGGTGGLTFGDAEIFPAEKETQTPLDDRDVSESTNATSGDDPYLGPWANFLDTLEL